MKLGKRARDSGFRFEEIKNETNYDVSNYASPCVQKQFFKKGGVAYFFFKKIVFVHVTTRDWKSHNLSHFLTSSDLNGGIPFP